MMAKVYPSQSPDTSAASDGSKAEFMQGVFWSMQYLVLTRGENQLARELANESGLHQEEALQLSKLTGFQVRTMNRFIRDELRP